MGKAGAMYVEDAEAAKSGEAVLEDSAPVKDTPLTSRKRSNTAFKPQLRICPCKSPLYMSSFELLER